MKDNKKIYPGFQYQKLFDYMADNHSLILLESEMQDIIEVVNEIQTQQPTDEQKNVYQLFIGKVSEILGTAKTMQLLKESHETFNEPE